MFGEPNFDPCAARSVNLTCSSPVKGETGREQSVERITVIMCAAVALGDVVVYAPIAAVPVFEGPATVEAFDPWAELARDAAAIDTTGEDVL